MVYVLEIRPITADEMRRIGSGTEGKVPLEQSEAWQQFSGATGHPLWKRLGWFEDGKAVAVAAFYSYDVRGMQYLWSRRGPVWLKEPTPAREAEALDRLRDIVRLEAPRVAFIRLHSWYVHPGLREPFRVVGYDRTAIIDGCGGDRVAAQQAMPKSGRRLIARAQKRFKEAGGVIAEETGLSRSAFSEFYELMRQTAQRDGFTPHDEEHYWTMLVSLGPEHARLFSARVDGQLACWDLVGVYGKNATAFYGASSPLSRSVQAAPLVDFEAACIMAEEGRAGLDLMGIHSPRTPSLYDVGRYKMQFVEHYTDVAGLWDLPVRPARYGAIQTALTGRRLVRGARSRLAPRKAANNEEEE